MYTKQLFTLFMLLQLIQYLTGSKLEAVKNISGIANVQVFRKYIFLYSVHINYRPLPLLRPLTITHSSGQSKEIIISSGQSKLKPGSHLQACLAYLNHGWFINIGL